MLTKARARLENAFTSAQFSYQELRGMFLTLILDQFFIVFINVLSSAMVSSTGEAAMAAVTMVGSVNAMVSLIFSAISVGGAIVIARAKGKGDLSGVRGAIGETTCLCGTISIVFGGLMYALSDTVVGVLYPRAEPLLIEYSVHYMRLICISFVPYSIFSVIFNAFRSLGDTKSSLLLTIVINGAHLIFSFVFINQMNLGVTGAGLSYIAARVIGMVLALLWMLKIHNQYGVRVRHMFRFTKEITSEIVKLGVPIAFESALFQGGMLLVQIYLAFLTTTELAAHGVANSVLNLYYSTGNALTALASTVCGQAFGAGLYALTKKYCVNLVKVGRFIMLATCMILLPLTPVILLLFSPSSEALPIVYRCLLIAAVGMPTIWCDGYVTPMALRAAGDVVYPTVVSVGALFIGRIGVGYVLTIVAGLGVPGVWIGMLVEWLLRAVLLRRRVNGTKWLHIKDKEVIP